MEQAKLEKWNCVDCEGNVICKPHTLAVLGRQLYARGPFCAGCRHREKEDRIKYSSNFSRTDIIH